MSINIVLKIVLALLLIIVAVLVISSIKFNRKVNAEVKILLTKAKKEDKIITEQMLKGLPAPVQRYLRHSGIVGKPWINTVSLKQTGKLKTDPQGMWVPFAAEEYFSINPPRFFWHTWAPSPWLPLIRGSDGYKKGEGQLLITLFSLIQVGDARGKEINQGEMVRYLNEVMWFPTAFLSDNISWEPIDNNSAKVILTDQGSSVSAVMRFDDQGKLTSFVAQRYYLEENKYSLKTWEVPITSYSRMAGLNLPTGGYTVWKLKSGDFSDVDVSVNEIEYNVSR